ncbi:hypothetical protein N7457_005964 [Penicillium paradoxum]|uniref:uncharacterized protein n=1 Tax=Penicillium paradoxum TaxID=176176 RepID=UPI002549854B|nr:uncharacterized protein N7457_005964 [Penicillium paradoxum]KAJ5780804.1 hypothetical protein N7457_005964 [Penicillium paradoxum]
MPPQSSSDTIQAALIMVSTEESNEAIVSSRDKKSKGRRRNKQDNVATPRKSRFLNEIGDELMEQLHATPKSDDNGDLKSSCVSVMDHLRNNLAPAVTASSCASVASHSIRTLAGSTCTPATSVDLHEPLGVSRPQARTAVDSSHPHTESEPKKVDRDQAAVFSLDDFTTMTTIERLAAQHGRVAHMGILDHSYRFFVNKSRTAALSFKVQNGVAVIGGDPLCSTDEIPELLEEFREYRLRYNWSIAFMGASESFLHDYAHPNGWTTIRFGIERVLNPQTNDVLLENSGKRMITQNRQLLNPNKGGNTLGVYAPAIHGTNPHLQTELIAIYDAWRAERNCSASPQAFITVYDPFALPTLMTFIYTRNADKIVNGFAALRHLGSGGYHVDPCIAAPGSAKGISDLLLIAAMALLNRAGVSYLGFGFEPLHALGSEDVIGMPSPFERFTRDLYSRAFQRLPIGGKKAYHDKLRPDSTQDSALYLVFPPGVPGPRHLLAMAHMANISLRKIMWADVRSWMISHRSKVDAWCSGSFHGTTGALFSKRSKGTATNESSTSEPVNGNSAAQKAAAKTSNEWPNRQSVNDVSVATKPNGNLPDESLTSETVKVP